MSPERAAAWAQVYLSLAEALAEPPDWMEWAGSEWLLYRDVQTLAVHLVDPELDAISLALARIPPESSAMRRRRYEALFFAGAPRLQLYESLWRDGRLVSDTTFALWETYTAAGLAVAGSELPDHVSVELAFLAHLYQQEADAASDVVARRWRKVRRQCVTAHAGRWIPKLGRALAAAGDVVYAPVGRLLVYSLGRRSRRPKLKLQPVRLLPVIDQPANCTLCGFCASVCPTGALVIRETAEKTALLLNGAECTGCDRCAGICPPKVVHLAEGRAHSEKMLLFESPREACLRCGQPMISQAEMEAIVAQIGEAVWLGYCLDCRMIVMEKIR